MVSAPGTCVHGMWEEVEGQFRGVSLSAGRNRSLKPRNIVLRASFACARVCHCDVVL